MELTGKERQFFKKAAHALKPIFQVGKSGMSQEMMEQIIAAADKRELIKITLLQNTIEEVESVKEQIERYTPIEVIQIIGHTLVLYKKSSKEKYRVLSKQFEEKFGKK